MTQVLMQLLRCGVVVVTATFAFSSDADAQLLSREDVTFSASFTGFDTGANEQNCPEGSGGSIGLGVRVGGAWFVGGGVQLHMAGPSSCKGVGILEPHGGDYAEEFSGVELRPAGSGLVVGGWRARIGERELAVTTGVRGVWASISAPQRSWRLMPWLGAGMAVDRLIGPIGFGVETGWLRTPVVLRVYENGAYQTVAEHGRWRPLWQVGVRIRPWGPE
jgi:hypothetical protein